MTPRELNAEQRAKVDQFKALPKKKGRPPKEFGPLLKAAATVLRESGMSLEDIATELHIGHRTAARMFSDTTVKVDSADMVKIRESFSQNITEIINKMLTAANSDDYVDNLAKSRNPGLVEAISKLIEKLQLLQGKPSNIMEVRDTAKLIEEKVNELKQIEEALQNSLIVPEDPKAN